MPYSSHRPQVQDGDALAAIDLGSNSFHMVLAQHMLGQLRVVDRLRETVRMADGLDEKGGLDKQARQRALDCLARFGQRLRGVPRLHVRALATNTVRRLRDPQAFLRAAEAAGAGAMVLADPAGKRTNTKDNTPGVVNVKVVPGNTVDVIVAAKGGGSEAKSKFAMLNPSDSIVDWVLKTVPTMGAGWCPPGMLGIGIGGTAEKAMLLAKESLMEPIDITDLQARGPSNRAEELRLELYEKVNALGIGAQGLGGLTTVLDIKVKDYPTHAANLPVAMIPNCAATRHAHFTLGGSGPVMLDPPSLEDWPELTYDASKGRRVDLDTLTREDVASWKPGEVLLLNGKLLTGRDAAHKRMVDMLNKGEPLPVDLKGRFIYYVGPVDPVRDEVVGPAGPTTATRMDKFTEQVLAQTGLLGMVGKAERGPAAIEAIKKHQSAYLMAVGGAAYLVSKAIKAAKVVGFADLGMEAIYEFTVQDMPVTVAVDAQGTSVHQTGPKEWQARIGKIPVVVA